MDERSKFQKHRPCGWPTSDSEAVMTFEFIQAQGPTGCACTVVIDEGANEPNLQIALSQLREIENTGLQADLRSPS